MKAKTLHVLYRHCYPSTTGCSFMICRSIRTLPAAHARFLEQTKGLRNVEHYMKTYQACTAWAGLNTESSRWLSSSIAGTYTEHPVFDTHAHWSACVLHISIQPSPAVCEYKHSLRQSLNYPRNCMGSAPCWRIKYGFEAYLTPTEPR